MPPTLTALGIDRMSLADRIALLEAIRDSIPPQTATASFIDVQRVESFASERIAPIADEMDEDFNPDLPAFSLPVVRHVQTRFTKLGQYAPSPLPDLDD